MQIETDNEEWEGETLMIVLCNGPREGGGFLVAPEAHNNDGFLDYMTIWRVSRLMMFRLISEVMRGTHASFSQVRMGQFKRLSLTSDGAVHIPIDVEIFAGFSTEVRQLSVKVLPEALAVIV